MTDPKSPSEPQEPEKWYERTWYQILLFAGGIAVFALFMGLLLDWYINPQTSAQKKDLVQALGLITAGVAGAVGIFFTWRGQQLSREAQEDRDAPSNEGRSSRGLLIGFAIVGAILVVVLLLMWVKPSDPTEKKAFIQAVGVLLAALAGLGGLYFTSKNLKQTRQDTEKQLQQARDSTGDQLQQARESQEENQRLTEQGQITERFTRAIEQLGATDEATSNPRLELRLGGIYALERIARDSPKRDYSTVMEVLTAYVRQNAPNAPLPQSKTMMPSTPPITDLINKALLNARERLSVEMMKSSTPSEEQDAEVTSPAPRTDIQAILTVLGRTKQRGEDPIPELDLRQTDLRGAHLRGDLRRVRLYNADLRGAHLQRANLWRADLQDAWLHEADLRGANLQRAKLQEAILQDADLRTTDLQRANLRGANLQGADLQRANLRGAYLKGAYLKGATPRGANLFGANLQEANLQEARLRGADLRATDLQGASFQGASLREARLQRANLRGADLRQVEKGTLDQEQIRRACGDERTTLPESLQRPRAWGNSPDDQTDGDQ